MFSRLPASRLIRKLRDRDDPDWFSAMRELGTMPEVEGAVEALAGQLDGSGGLYENAVVETLGGIDDERATMALARRLGLAGAEHGQWRIAKALGHPRHAGAVAEIVAAARRAYRRNDGCGWAEGTLRAIGTPEALSGIEQLGAESVPHLLRSARQGLGMGGIPNAEVRRLELLDSAAAREALRQVRHEMVKPLLAVALTHESFSAVEDALAALSQIGTPEADAAVEQFFAAPPRQVTRTDCHEEQDENGALQHWTTATQLSTRCFGRAPSADASAVARGDSAPALAQPLPEETTPSQDRAGPVDRAGPPADGNALRDRLIAALRRRGAVPEGNPTLGEIARHADAMLGRNDIHRFVFEFYYPLQYGERTSAEAARFAEDIVRRIEQP